MTTLLSWISVDNRGPSAIYIVTDSRITWGSSQSRWESGRKAFAMKSADIFGYCGDALFPSMVLGQVEDMIGRALLFEEDCDAENRHAAIFKYLQKAFECRHNAPNKDFSILHCSRDGSGLACDFLAWKITYNTNRRQWADTRIAMPKVATSAVLSVLGSGQTSLDDEIHKWNETSQGNTARAYFSAFCDALKTGKDPLTGGMPQIVSLDRRSQGKIVGFVDENIRYIHGLSIEWAPNLETIEWVDGLFQRLSPKNLQLLSEAQRHVRATNTKSGGISTFLRKLSHKQ